LHITVPNANHFLVSPKTLKSKFNSRPKNLNLKEVLPQSPRLAVSGLPWVCQKKFHNLEKVVPSAPTVRDISAQANGLGKPPKKPKA
jgi:hypothetical protein